MSAAALLLFNLWSADAAPPGPAAPLVKVRVFEQAL